MEGEGVVFEAPDSFEMPAMDKYPGICGVVNSTGGCPNKGVVRMAVEVQYSDEDRYYTGPYFTPYMGDEVMIDLCEKHKDGVRTEYEHALKILADREKERAAADQKVKELEEELRVARAARDRI
jgi:hypothetical protein